MAERSTLGEFVLWLHQDALNDNRIDPAAGDETSVAILEAIRTGRGHPVGVELFRGRPDTPIARQMLRAATKRLLNLDTLKRYVDEKGYTTISLRALLAHHYSRIQHSRIGSDENDLWIDLNQALKKASNETQQVAAMLVAGQGPKEIGEKFKTNGSRKVSYACVELLKHLERKPEAVDG